MLGGYLAAGGAGAINHYIERDRDARMDRTCARPLASGRIAPLHGLVFGLTLGAARDRQLALTVNAAGGGAGARRAARLRPPLHDVAEAADPAEHRPRRRRRRDPAAGRLGRRDRRARARGALAVRDRLPLDAAALLGAVAADQRRLRAHRRADAARGRAARTRPGARSSATRCCWSRSRSLPALTGLFGGLYLVAALALGAGFIGLAALRCCATRRARPRCALPLLAAYLALLFGAMAADRVF